MPSIWIIDYRTAKKVFSSGNNSRIAKIMELIENNELYICDCEVDLFKSDPKLDQAFLNGNNCVIVPEVGGDILMRANNIANSNTNVVKDLLEGNDSAILISATVLSKRGGLISDHEHVVWTTVCDICRHYGVTVLSSKAFFQKFPPN